MPATIEIETETLIKVTENIVEALLCDLTQDGKYSPQVLRGMAEYTDHPHIDDFLKSIADKIEALARDNMNCTCEPDSEELCVKCKLLS